MCKIILSASELYAQFYDTCVPDWPGEIDFYQRLADEASAKGQVILELACGTGRIAIRLAQAGASVTGLDLSPAMLDIARAKSAGMPNLRWVEGNMRSFNLDQEFGLAIIPGHPFQLMLTPEDQIACLQSIRRHLLPGGLLILHLDHQDIDWLGNLFTQGGERFEDWQEVRHPTTGRLIRTATAWSYERATQTASATTIWEELDAAGEVSQRWQRGPIQIHCAFRFEIEHLLARTGFEILALYGDFFQGELGENSSEMIWLAQRPLSC